MSFCDDRDRRREQRGDRADPRHDRARVVGDVEERVRAHDEEHAGGDHRRRVDERRDRGRALHRVGQPDVQRELRALAHRADEEQQRDRGDRRLREVRRRGVGDAVVERPDLLEDQEHREHEAEVADAVRDERLLARDRGRVALEPERDEQVRAEAHALPAQEGEQEARAEHEHEHRRREQVEVREEPAEARVAVHVPDRVQVDQRADAGDEQDHRRRERIDEEAEVDAERRRPGST